jgi:hypothetical protein
MNGTEFASAIHTLKKDQYNKVTAFDLAGLNNLHSQLISVNPVEAQIGRC